MNHSGQNLRGLVIGLVCVAAVGGCAKQNAWQDVNVGREVALGEFASATPMNRTPELPSNQPAMNVDVDEADDAQSDAPPVTIVEASPDDDQTSSAAQEPIEAGEQVVVDSLIGQVNGRPIFADEFFEPIEAQLTAASQRLNKGQFNQEALRIVTGHLEEVVLNELFLAEAEASLSSEERKGIFGFMRYLQERTLSEAGGIEQEARKRLALQDLTLEQYLELEKNRALIQKLIMEKIRPRVIVSWRDIEREYERRIEEFNPPAQVTLLRIRLNSESDATRIEEVKTRLLQGDPFEDIATDIGDVDGGRWRTIQMGGAETDEVALSSEFIDRLGEIKVGTTTEPFELSSSTWWLHVAEVDQPPARSIYDPGVQRMLSDHLHSVRFNEEFMHYRSKLFQRGIFDELNEMRDRLMAVAILRYGP